MEFLKKLKIRIFLIPSLFWVAVSFFLWFSISPITHLNASEPDTSGPVSSGQKASPPTDSTPVTQSSGNILRFKHLTIEEGLTTSEVRGFAQDDVGYMWLATPAGLNRYDGYSVKQYKYNSMDKNSLSTNVVHKVLTDYLGHLWVATDKGLNRYQSETDNFTVYLHDDKSNSISNNSISALYEDSQHNLWVGTRLGLNKYNRESNNFTRYMYDENSPSNSLRQGKIRTIYEDSRGLIWIGTTSGSVAMHRGISILNPKTGRFTHFDHNAIDTSSLQEGSLVSIFETDNEQLWVVTNEGGLSEYLPKSGKFRRINFVTNNSQSDFKKMNTGIVDIKDKIWLATSADGLLYFDHNTGTFIQYKNDVNDATSLSDNSLNSIYEDRDNLLWIGSVTSGANIFDYRTELFNHQLPHKQLENYNSSSIRSFYELDHQKLYIGSSIDRLIEFDLRTQRYKKLFEDRSKSSVPDPSITDPSITDPSINKRAAGLSKDNDGNLLLGTNRGFYIINPKDQQRQYIPLDLENDEKIVNIIKTFVSEDGTYWLASAGNGLFSYDAINKTLIHFPFSANNAAVDQQSLSSYYPRDIFEDAQGYLWIATIRGLNRFDRQTKTFKHYLNDPNDITNLPENKIFQLIEEDDNSIWLATNNGLVLFNKTTETFRRFTTEDGIANNNIYCMQPSGDNLWLGTNDGLTRWNRHTYKATNFYKEDGLQSNEFNTYGCHKGDSGKLYFAGINGFNYFSPKDIAVNRNKTSMAITNVMLDSQQVNYNNVEHIDIPFDSHVLQIDFRALDYFSPGRLQYQIKLIGFDLEWRDIGSTNNTIYTNMDAGRYVFHVKATNHLGITSSEKMLVFIKQSHPLLSAFAIIIYVLIIIMLIILYMRYQREQLEKHKDIADRESKLSQELRQLSIHLQKAREDERSNLARELHDELAQVLVAIKLEIYWIQSNLERDEITKVLSRIPEIDQTVDACVSSVKDIAMGLRPSVLDDMGLVPALDWYIESTCKRANLKVSFSTNCETIHLSKDLSINIYRIVQETCTNIIKHASAKNISMYCSLENNIFQLEIKDDGIGIKKSNMEKPGHYGLLGIRERVAAYEGYVTIRANQPTGVAVTITIPVANFLMAS